MGRLTKRGAISQRDIEKLLVYSNENQFGPNNAYFKLQDYEDLEEQGLLLRLPCKVGDKVYCIFAKTCGHDWCSDDCFKCEDSHKEIIECMFNVRMFDDLGITVFLTKAEAEKALAEMENKIC